MDNRTEKQKKMDSLAYEIMNLSRNQVMIVLRFLDRAFFHMSLVASDSIPTYAMDGNELLFNSTDFFKTKLKGIDLSDCIISNFIRRQKLPNCLKCRLFSNGA